MSGIKSLLGAATVTIFLNAGCARICTIQTMAIPGFHPRLRGVIYE